MFARAMLEQPYQYFKQRLVCIVLQLSILHQTYTCFDSKEEGDVPFCAANILLERMDKNGQHPEEAESVVKATLSSMYAGKESLDQEVPILFLTYYCRRCRHCRSSMLLSVITRY